MGTRLGNATKELGIIAGSATIIYFALGSGMLEPEHSHIEEAVAAELRDPSSAQFRNIREGTETACGEVNAKNAFGAYTGFRQFAYRRGIILFEPEQSAGFSTEQLTRYYEDQARFLRMQRQCTE